MVHEFQEEIQEEMTWARPEGRSRYGQEEGENRRMSDLAKPPIAAQL
jgi:hypothetical protein